MSANRQRRRALRPLRTIALLVVAALLYTVVGGYLPFARCPEPEDAAAIEALADDISRDVATADRATILETSTDALDERIRLMQQAEREIVMTTYECHDGESTRDLLAVACHRAGEGIRVRFLADGIAGRLDIAPNDCFKAAASLPNVEIRFYNPPSLLAPWKHMGRMHDKYVIVDDLAYILGGRNMYDGFLGDYPTRRHYSHDREALVYNGAHGSGGGESSLFQLMEYFEGMWSLPDTAAFSPGKLKPERREEILGALEERYQRLRREKPALFAEADYEAATLPTDGIWLLSNPTTIYAKQPTLFYQLCALMARAKKGVVIHSPYAVLNGAMAARLKQIAGAVPVTLMVNAVENGANVVGSSDYLYHRSQVIDTGVRLLEYAGGRSYHGKSIAIDDNLSVIGCYNLDLRSTYVDTELMLVIRGREVNALLRRHMNALHADCRRVIDADTARVPEGLVIRPLPLWKRAALRALGGAMQLVRNLV